MRVRVCECVRVSVCECVCECVCVGGRERERCGDVERRERGTRRERERSARDNKCGGRKSRRSKEETKGEQMKRNEVENEKEIRLNERRTKR